MAIRIPIPAKNLTVEQLAEIYYRFCKAYKFEADANDEVFLRDRGIKTVNSGSILDYRPFMGAKFFAAGNDRYIKFWGYTSDKPQSEEEKRFERMVVEYLGK
jgi:hypothetical protein